MIQVHDTRPQALRPNFNDLSSVEKYVLPDSKYESLSNSVLAWKKNQKLGRFDPNAQSPEELRRNQAEKDVAEVKKRGQYFIGNLGLTGPFLTERISINDCGIANYQISPFQNVLLSCLHLRLMFDVVLSALLVQHRQFRSQGLRKQPQRMKQIPTLVPCQSGSELNLMNQWAKTTGQLAAGAISPALTIVASS